jgi:DinB superfamily
MRMFRLLGAVAVALVLVIGAVAQGGPPPTDPKNPVTSYVKLRTTRQMQNITSAAEAMPAENYSFKPTEGQQPFGWVVSHIVTSNLRVCQAIGDQTPPEGLSALKPEDPKDKLVAGLKSAFDYCKAALDKVDDSKLADQVQVGQNKIARANALLTLPIDYADHYAQMAMYLRLKNITPPSAQRR